MSHPFGDLLRQHLLRRRGLTQKQLAELAGYDPAILVRMGQGKKDLTGPSGRERVVRLVAVLRDEGVLATVEEANALLAAAHMPPLYAGQPNEAALIQILPVVGVGGLATANHGLPIRHNLPAPLTPLIGRLQEVAEVKRLLGNSRLLTLTGLGGVGKTRLALRVAYEVLANYTHGVWFVSLAPVGDPALVPATIARALGVNERPGQPALEGVIGYLRHKRLLLVLDNYESLLQAATVTTDLLTASPFLTVLATSRVPLRLSGEQEFDVPSLELSAATTLFVQRARAIQPRFSLDGDNRAAVTEICNRVDRLPLAIELVAAQIRHLPLHALLSQLHPPSPLHLSQPFLDGQVSGGKGLGLLTDSPRDLPPRQRTFRNTLDWSYRLLNERERLWFRRLGVFAGGATLEQVAQLDPTSPEGVHDEEVEGVLRSLKEQNLARAENDPDDRLRYSLLELVREYALEKLAECDELDTTRHRHALAYLALAQAAGPHLHTGRQREWTDRLEREHDNIRAALARSLSPGGDAVLGLRLANHLWPFWWINHLAEGQRWLALLLDAAGSGASPEERGRALLGNGILLLSVYDWDAAPPALEQALTLLRQVNDLVGVSMGLSALGLVWGLARGRPTEDVIARKLSLVEEGLALSRQTGSAVALSWALNTYAEVLWWQRDCERAKVAYEERLAHCRKTGDADGTVSALFYLGTIALYQLDFARAKMMAEEALQVARSSGGYVWLAAALLEVGEVAQLTGALDRAWACLEEAHALANDYGLSYEAGFIPALLGRVARDRHDYAWARTLFEQALVHFPRPVGGPYALEGLACLAGAQGRYARAVRLFSFIEAYREKTSDPWWPKDLRDLGPYIDTARTHLDEETFATAWTEGRAMTPEQAAVYALQGNEIDEPPVR